MHDVEEVGAREQRLVHLRLQPRQLHIDEENMLEDERGHRGRTQHGQAELVTGG
jgi:hypothetical protein